MSLSRLSRILTANLAGLFRRNGKLVLEAKSTREFSSEGEDYYNETVAQIQRSQASSLIKELSTIDSLEEEHIIEIGCGDGVISANVFIPSLLPIIRSYTALDIDPLIIKHCQKEFKNSAISFFVADITRLESLEKHWKNYFTLALSLNVMGGVDPELAFLNISRLLESNGYYVFSWSSAQVFLNILRDVADKYRIPRQWLHAPERQPDSPVLKDLHWQLAKQSNFEVDQLDVSYNCFSFEDGNAVRGTWNMRTLHRDYSLGVLMQELQRYNLHILGLQKTRTVKDLLKSRNIFSELPPLMREEFFDNFYNEYKKQCGETVPLRTVSGIFRKV